MEKSVPKAVPKPVLTGTIVIDDPSVVKMLAEKDRIVNEGRGLSAQIDDIQKQIDALSDEERALTEKVEPKELIEEGEKIKAIINEQVKELEAVATKIREQKLAAIPKEMEEKHLKLNSEREQLETDRNKLALKVQKIKDRLVPKIQKIAKEHLEEFEDLLSAELHDGKVVVEKFSHIEEWKRLWREKNVR